MNLAAGTLLLQCSKAASVLIIMPRLDLVPSSYNNDECPAYSLWFDIIYFK